MSSMGSLEALSAVLRDSKTGLAGISTYAAGLGGASHASIALPRPRVSLRTEAPAWDMGPGTRLAWSP